MNKTCDYCGTEFETSSHRAKYCSDAHKMAARRGKAPVASVSPQEQESSESTDIVLTKTDKLFDSHNPNYYKFSDELFSRSCLMCGANFTTHLSMCRVCSPKCKEDALRMLVTMK